MITVIIFHENLKRKVYVCTYI